MCASVYIAFYNVFQTDIGNRALLYVKPHVLMDFL